MDSDKITKTVLGVIIGIIVTDILEASGTREEIRQGIRNIANNSQDGNDGRSTV